MTYIQSLHPEGRIDMIRNQADKLGKLLEVDHEAQRLIYIDSNSRNEVTTFSRYQAYGRAFRLICT
jgi:hypothetical protein